MTLISEAAEKIRNIADEDQRRRYASALRDSVIWNRFADDVPPEAARDILERHLVSENGAETNGVLLTKAGIVEYATELGQSLSIDTFRKNFTKTKYAEHFTDNDRAIVTNGAKLLITYAEARSYLGAPSLGSVPDFINDIAD